MMFFFRKPTIVLDCFTDNSYLYEYLSIQQASKFFPDWWKQLPKEYISKKSPTQLKLNTMKSCRGIVSLYQNGIILPLWSDYSIKVGSKALPKILFETPTQYKAAWHDAEQWGGESYLSPKNYGHLKLDCPWYIREKTGVQFAFIQPFYNTSTPTDYLFPPGVVDYKYQNSGNVNLFFEFKEDERTILLRAGDPIAMILPLTEKDVKIKNHLVSPMELNKMNPKPLTFNHHYTWLKGYMNQKESKCPFGFKK